MTIIIVKKNILSINDKTYECSFGKNGFTTCKVEGDNKTPLGNWQLGRLFYRADKLNQTGINLDNVKLDKIPITQQMGWSDDLNDKNYNQLINLPSQYSHEKLWREDGLYDIVIELEYNYKPIVSGKGSAIFFHIAKENYSQTEGCIAVSMENMVEILSLLDKNNTMVISSD